MEFLTKETVKEAIQNPEKAAELVTMLKQFLALQYFMRAEELEQRGMTTDMLKPLKCEYCGELTQYSGTLIGDYEFLDKICLSDKCIFNAILLASLKF